jgi:hypothetical protein
MNREEQALAIPCPDCRAGAGERCRRLRAIGLSRVPGRKRIMHPHAARVALARQQSQVAWPYDLPGSYHDVGRCGCEGHCLNCFADLAEIRRVRTELIADGRIRSGDQLGPRERYCSGYCRGRAQRERALDRAIAAESRKRRPDDQGDR